MIQIGAWPVSASCLCTWCPAQKVQAMGTAIAMVSAWRVREGLQRWLWRPLMTHRYLGAAAWMGGGLALAMAARHVLQPSPPRHGHCHCHCHYWPRHRVPAHQRRWCCAGSGAGAGAWLAARVCWRPPPCEKANSRRGAAASWRHAGRLPRRVVKQTACHGCCARWKRASPCPCRRHAGAHAVTGLVWGCQWKHGGERRRGWLAFVVVTPMACPQAVSQASLEPPTPRCRCTAGGTA